MAGIEFRPLTSAFANPCSVACIQAFSVVVPASVKVLGIDPAKININGGAVALG